MCLTASSSSRNPIQLTAHQLSHVYISVMIVTLFVLSSQVKKWHTESAFLPTVADDEADDFDDGVAPAMQYGKRNLKVMAAYKDKYAELTLALVASMYKDVPALVTIAGGEFDSIPHSFLTLLNRLHLRHARLITEEGE